MYRSLLSFRRRIQFEYFFQDFEDKAKKSNQTKRAIFQDMKQNVTEALDVFKENGFLKKTMRELEGKTEKSFQTKEKLIAFSTTVTNFIKDLKIEKEIFAPRSEHVESDNEDELDDF